MNKKRAVVLCFILVCLAVTYAVAATPGSDTDPVVSLSYLNEVFKPEVKEEVAQTTQFQLVNISAGQKLIGGMGTEMILRMGSANIVATQTGGLADVTAGVDIANGLSAPSNHLLIVPRDDGRGIVALNDCIVMVKGEYKIK